MKILPALVLWDIDGTLLTVGGAGKRAYAEAGRRIFGESFTLDGVDTYGRSDTAIWHDVARLNGSNTSAELEQVFRKCYRADLRAQIELQKTVQLLPGVREIVEQLAKMESLTQGILSGNYPEIGRLKVESGGLDCERFSIWVGGSDGLSRSGLLSVALAQYADLTGGAIDMSQVVLIGDTPRDIDCARANGCNCIAVATGAFSRHVLEETGAGTVFDDLSKPGEVIDSITGCLQAKGGQAN